MGRVSLINKGAKNTEHPFDLAKLADYVRKIKKGYVH
jgi:hypothetical protein